MDKNRNFDFLRIRQFKMGKIGSMIAFKKLAQLKSPAYRLSLKDAATS
jgi:hypothetical protein